MNDLVTIAAPDRMKFLGGSDAAAVLGVSPWKTPVKLWLEKTGQAKEEAPDPQRQRVFNRGKKLEPIVLDMLIDKLREQGHEVELLAINNRYIDPEYGFLACEIDFELMLDGEHINGDCKTVHGFAHKKWGEEETDEIPIEYAAQFMHGLMITGRRRCCVAALIGLDDVAIYWIERDEETIAAMRAKEVMFWNECVIPRCAPDPLIFDDIKDLFPLDNGLAIEATEEIAAKVREYAALREKASLVEAQSEELKFQISDYISPHARLTFGGIEIASWKGQNRSDFEEKRFKEDHPELAEKYIKRRVIRVLRTKKGK